ncbi:MAG: MBL fold metallo-hydrolase [Spirochaetota bacterium]|nr:MBL fold metallo-hydrolase [Spirochaetota bacterium]
MNIQEITPNLHLINLKQDISGFRNFISSWIFNSNINFLVDIGPAATIKSLLEALEELNIKKLDYILLTHIHLDHAGGIGHLIDLFPEAKVVCCQKGIKHLVDPEKLWEGSTKALKDIALKYGQIKPTPKERIIPAEEFNSSGIQAINTPGHAAHHVSYVYDKYLFAGEAGGVFHSFNNELYLRPATPPVFYLEEAVESINKLIELGKKHICYGHFGHFDNSLDTLSMHKNQLYLWKNIISDVLNSSSKENLIENCVSTLLSRDDLFKPLNGFDEDIIQRELYFVKNSIRGYLGYLEVD